MRGLAAGKPAVVGDIATRELEVVELVARAAELVEEQQRRGCTLTGQPDEMLIELFLEALGVLAGAPTMVDAVTESREQLREVLGFRHERRMYRITLLALASAARARH